MKSIIRRHSTEAPSMGEVEVEVVFDETNDHYELLFNGWNMPYRIQGPVIRIDIRNGKIWIQHDGTYESVAEELVAEGVPHEHIVLAYRLPRMRPHTGFAMAQ